MLETTDIRVSIGHRERFHVQKPQSARYRFKSLCGKLEKRSAKGKGLNSRAPHVLGYRVHLGFACSSDDVVGEMKRVGQSRKMGGMYADREGKACSRNGKSHCSILIIKSGRGYRKGEPIQPSGAKEASSSAVGNEPTQHPDEAKDCYGIALVQDTPSRAMRRQ